MKSLTVVEFKPKQSPSDKGVLDCSNCSRQDFYICADGSVECRGCGWLSAVWRAFDRNKYSVIKNEPDPAA